ncbi:MAG: hypothetical protein AB8B65_08720 [Kordia sp.]|uniref:hypothetical protein n=1 Tax=Kordia sp. TaxID=1965332 RepID=UPI00385FAC6F
MLKIQLIIHHNFYTSFRIHVVYDTNCSMLKSLKNANAQQRAAVYEYEQILLKAYQEVTNQLSSIENLSKSYELKKQQVTSLTESINFQSTLSTYYS